MERKTEVPEKMEEKRSSSDTNIAAMDSPSEVNMELDNQTTLPELGTKTLSGPTEKKEQSLESCSKNNNRSKAPMKASENNMAIDETVMRKKTRKQKLDEKRRMGNEFKQAWIDKKPTALADSSKPLSERGSSNTNRAPMDYSEDNMELANDTISPKVGTLLAPTEKREQILESSSKNHNSSKAPMKPSDIVISNAKIKEPCVVADCLPQMDDIQPSTEELAATLSFEQVPLEVNMELPNETIRPKQAWIDKKANAPADSSEALPESSTAMDSPKPLSERGSSNTNRAPVDYSEDNMELANDTISPKVGTLLAPTEKKEQILESSSKNHNSSKAPMKPSDIVISNAKSSSSNSTAMDSSEVVAMESSSNNHNRSIALERLVSRAEEITEPWEVDGWLPQVDGIQPSPEELAAGLSFEQVCNAMFTRPGVPDPKPKDGNPAFMYPKGK